MKKIISILFVTMLVLSFIGIWKIVSSGYDKQNKIILTLKKIIPTKIAKEVKNTIFFVPNLINRNEYLELQLRKFEQGLQGEMFSEKNISLENKKYNYNLRNFFLPFPSLDINLGWKARKNNLRAHYLEIIDDNVLVMSGAGETVYFKRKNINNPQLDLIRLKNNLEQTLTQRGAKLAAIRDLFYEDNYIYISILETKNQKSFLNIYRAKKNFNNLNFEIFFKNDETVEGTFNLQTGGRITSFLPNEILFSVGFFNKYKLAQDENSIFGKIISINKDTRKYRLISIGHRNPQGLYFLKEKNLIINTEHGPNGGDEVNLNFLDKKKLINFGWPIASYGVPYPNQDKTFFQKNGYLKKSHSKNGFEEPLKNFSPSIGISEVTYNNNKLYVSSLRAESIYILELSQDDKLKGETRIKFDSRIRDLKYDKENGIFLILFESIPAIGVLKFKS